VAPQSILLVEEPRAARVVVDRQRVCEQRCPSRKSLESWVSLALAQSQDGPEEGEVTVRYVSAEESRALNARFRDRHRPTNVLSFPASDPGDLGNSGFDSGGDPSGVPGSSPAYLGDLVICPTVVEAEADEQGKSRRAHHTHMVVHGILHLLGYDHLSLVEAEQMESIEIHVLALLGLPDPYA